MSGLEPDPESARVNLGRARRAWEQHIDGCRWCRPRVKAGGLGVKLCQLGEELRRVVQYRQAEDDGAPR